MSAARRATSIAWGVIALLSLGIGGYALFHLATSFEFVPPEVKANAFPSELGLAAHIAVSGVALLVGPFQFLKQVRTKAPRLHRWMGRIYVAACMIGGVAGGSIALYSSAGPIAGWGFFFLAVFWLFSTGAAFAHAMRRDFGAHERWMIRSFALTLAAVTLRLELLSIPILDIGFEGPYRVIAWTSWVPNLLLAEAWIVLRKPRRPTQKAGTAPA